MLDEQKRLEEIVAAVSAESAQQWENEHGWVKKPKPPLGKIRKLKEEA